MSESLLRPFSTVLVYKIPVLYDQVSGLLENLKIQIAQSHCYTWYFKIKAEPYSDCQISVGVCFFHLGYISLT